MKIISTAILAFSMALSANTYAAHEAGPFKVSSLRIGTDGTYVMFDPAPKACNGTNYFRAHARVLSDSTNYDSMYSLLLAAYSSGATLQYLFFNTPSGTDGCSTAGGLLQLHTLELSKK
ncbi:hypothetical protein ACVBE9_01645 [Eionea flava]